jgi:lipid-A-disaccharide synthase
LPPLIYIIAGEPSGDLLGGRLIAGLKERTGGALRIAGIGGEAMRAEGLDSLFPMAELSVMGLVEVLPRIPGILRRVNQTVADIIRLQPAAVLTIDSWGFTGRVQQRLKQLCPDIPRIHYVAPMVWVWKPNRTGKLAAVLDMLMTLLPFEPDWFLKDGLATVHVGHSVLESGADQGDGAAFRIRHHIGADVPVLLVLPGSRHSETSRLLPVFAAVVARLAPHYPGLTVIVPTVETVAAQVKQAVAAWPVPAVIVEGRGEKYDSFAAATVALAASGTVALELALARLPTVIAYRVSPVTAFIATRFFGLKVKFATLINVIMDRAVMPEFLQSKCRPELIASAVGQLLNDPQARQRQSTDAAEAIRRLGSDGPSPSLRAADAVLEFIARRKGEDPSGASADARTRNFVGKHMGSAQTSKGPRAL